MGTKTIAQMQGDVNTSLPTNGAGLITAAVLRGTINNLISQIFDDIGLRGGAADFNNQELLRATVTPNGEAVPVLLTQFLAGSKNASYSVLNLQDYLRFQANTRAGRRTALSNAISALFGLSQGGGILDCSGIEIELDSPFSVRDLAYTGSADVKVEMSGSAARNKVIFGLNLKKVDNVYSWQADDYLAVFGSTIPSTNLTGFKLLYPRINLSGASPGIIGLAFSGYLRCTIVGPYITSVAGGKAFASIKYARTAGIGQNSTGFISAASNTISAISKANPGVITYSGVDNWANDDQFVVVGGQMVELNNRIFMVGGIDTGANTFQIKFTDGSNVNTTTYTTYVSGGTVVKITDLTNHGLAVYDANFLGSAVAGSVAYYLEDGDCTFWGGIYGGFETMIKSLRGGLVTRGLHNSPEGFGTTQQRAIWLTTPRNLDEFGGEYDNSYIYIENSTDNLHTPGVAKVNFDDITINNTQFNGDASNLPGSNGAITFTTQTENSALRGVILRPVFASALTTTAPLRAFLTTGTGWWNGPASKRVISSLPNNPGIRPGLLPAGTLEGLGLGGTGAMPTALLFNSQTGALHFQDSTSTDYTQPFVKSIGNDLYIGRYLNTTITAVSKANPAVVTYVGADIFHDGEIVYLIDVTNMPEASGRSFTIAGLNTGANTFQLSGFNSSGFPNAGTAGTAIVEALRWKISSGGILQPAYDNEFDFGSSSGAAANLYMGTSLFRGSTKVVGAQGAAVADAAGGATVDAEARTAINTLLARLRTHGLIAT